MFRKTSIIAAAIAAGTLGVGLASPAFAATPQTGTVSGTVSVGEALQLQLVNTSFSVSNALPGVTDNGVPPIQASVAENDSAGYTLTSYMNDPTTWPGKAAGYPNCQPGGAFINTGGTVNIPDDAWTTTSTGGPGAAGTTQAYADQPNLGNLSGGTPTCNAPSPQATTIGQSGTVGDFTYTEQLAVTVPGTTASGDYAGTLTIALIGQ